MTTSPWLRELIDGWERSLAQLRSLGWSVEITCSAAPVQLEGTLPSGEPFSFRARHDQVELRVEPEGLGDAHPWVAAVHHEQASYLPGDQGLETILELWRSFQGTR